MSDENPVEDTPVEEVVAEEQQPECGQETRAIDPQQHTRERDGGQRKISLRAHRPATEARAPSAPLLAEDRQAFDRSSEKNSDRPEDGDAGLAPGLRGQGSEKGSDRQNEAPGEPGQGVREVGAGGSAEGLSNRRSLRGAALIFAPIAEKLVVLRA